LSPDVPQVTVKPGDNMTTLVKNHLISKGFVPNPSDLKKMVFDVARQNGISNPNLIFTRIAFTNGFLGSQFVGGLISSR
jgi:hypothetical protein